MPRNHGLLFKDSLTPFFKDLLSKKDIFSFKTNYDFQKRLNVKKAVIFQDFYLDRSGQKSKLF